MKDHYSMFAAYNRWANEILYDASSKLTDQQRREERGAFFGSIHATLNHILVGDTIWMNRFRSLATEIQSLDAILQEEFNALLEARQQMDGEIIDYVSGLNDEDFTANFTYRTIVNPANITQPLSPALAHFFNHQTHHRGQLHCLLTQIAGDAPSLDLLYYLRERDANE